MITPESFKLYVFKSTREYDAAAGAEKSKWSAVGVLNSFSYVSYTDEFNGAGNFSVNLAYTDDNKTICTNDSLVWLEGNTAGIIEDIEVSPVEKTMKISGRLASSVLDRRVLMEDYEATYKTGGAILFELFNKYTTTNKYTTGYFNELGMSTNLAEESSLGGTIAAIDFKAGENLLKVFETVCKKCGLGFSSKFRIKTRDLFLQVYESTDRSTSSETNEPVIFSRYIETLRSLNYFANTKTQKNIALIKSQNGLSAICPDGSTIQPVGLARRELYVDLTDSHYGGEGEYQAMLREGILALHNNAGEITCDAISSESVYKYKDAYFLGDIVTIQDKELGFQDDFIISQVSVSWSANEGVVVNPNFGETQKTLKSLLKEALEKVPKTTKYKEGTGITIAAGNVVSLKPAGHGTTDTVPNLGGVYTIGATGIKLYDDGLVSLSAARKNNIGGGKIGDGLEIITDVIADYDTPDIEMDTMLIRLGKGLMYRANLSKEEYKKLGYTDEEANKQLKKDNTLRGRAITLDLDKGLKFNDVVDEQTGKVVQSKLALNLDKGLTFVNTVDWVTGEVKESKLAIDTGSGLAFEEHADSEGIVTHELAVNIGDGLKFEEHTDANGNALKRIVPNIGENLEIGADGKINAKGGGSTLTPGDGVNIQNNVISVKVDGHTVKFNENKELTATGDGVVIENAVIVQEAEAEYILHNFTQTKYLAGNKIGYAGPGNPVIANGYMFYKDTNDLQALGSAPYTSVVFETARTEKNAWTTIKNCDFYMKFIRAGSNNVNEITLASNAIGYTYNSVIETRDLSKSGLFLVWLGIRPPGYHQDYPNGYVEGRVYLVSADSSGGVNIFSNSRVGIDVGFTSMAEYEAAVGLTYEPLTLTRIEDNPTIV